MLAAAALALPVASAAESGKRAASAAPPAAKRGGAFVPPGLLKKAERNGDETYRVIVQGSGRAARAVAAEGGRVGRELETVAGVAAELTGKQLVKLSRRADVVAVNEDALVAADYHSDQGWPYLAQVNQLWPSKKNKIQAATIAVVDSGVDALRPDLSGRVLEQVDLVSEGANAPGDGFGHGTFVAAVAAGGASGYAGAAPNAGIVSLDVLDDTGAGRVSDVIAAADWIYRNKDRLRIRVANFSLHAASPSSFRYDPLDQAVRKLWLAGVVVVASGGNYGNGKEGRVRYAPANESFIITVGAMDDRGTSRAGDDLPASWSAFGYTYDGFRKPDVGAPGRRLIAAVPPNAAMPLARPDRVVAPGYMWMSGTSFAAPVVAGAAAGILAVHPEWTPDQVKGALMVSTDPIYDSASPSWAIGVGRIDGEDAGLVVTNPPNPNEPLNRFLVPDPNGGSTLVFDYAAWYDAAWSDAAWYDAAWSDAAWSDAAWSSAAWSNAAWSDAAWSDAAWYDEVSADTAWADLLWID